MRLPAAAEETAFDAERDIEEIGDASFEGQRSVVQAMLAANANVDHVDGGYTPLICAVQGNHPDVVAVLVGAGADVGKGTADAAATTPLYWAAQDGFTGLVAQLIAANANAISSEFVNVLS